MEIRDDYVAIATVNYSINYFVHEKQHSGHSPSSVIVRIVSSYSPSLKNFKESILYTVAKPSSFLINNNFLSQLTELDLELHKMEISGSLPRATVLEVSLFRYTYRVVQK